jgi:glycosyltransferase involved in cell wall biosynthesis
VNIEAFRKELSGVTESDMSRVRQQFAIPAHAVIGLYCGSLYPDKHLPFLLQSATLIKEAIPGFELVIVGDGEQKALIQDAAQNLPWVHYAGPQFGYEKAVYFKMALLFLHPGATGLAILDSFAAGLPMITTDIPFHGPEIDYLENGVNGLILPFDRRSYADGIIALLADKERLAAIRECAAASAEKYTLDAMVNNFRAGILKCLEL